jgi:hypothetical protein
MAEGSKLSMAAHLASIGQFVIAVPCLVLAWLAYRHPSTFAPTPPVASSSNAWPSMLTPLTLLPVAVGILSVCVVAAGVLNFVVSRRHLSSTPVSIAVNDKLAAGATQWKTKEHWRLKYEAATSEITDLQKAHAEELRKLAVFNNAELWRANEARRLCEEERHEAEKNLKIFTPLQIEALQFRKRLQDFLAEYGPRRVVRSEDYPDSPEGIAEFNREKDKVERPGGFAFFGQFASRFRADAERLYYKFLAAGVTNIHFGSLAAAVNNRKNVEDLIGMLWEMAGAVERDGNEKS